jgi:hypothetical protein
VGDVDIQSIWRNLVTIERLNEHPLEDYLGGWKATAIYIVGDWVCHDFNSHALFEPELDCRCGQSPYHFWNCRSFKTAICVEELPLRIVDELFV